MPVSAPASEVNSTTSPSVAWPVVARCTTSTSAPMNPAPNSNSQASTGRDVRVDTSFMRPSAPQRRSPQRPSSIGPMPKVRTSLACSAEVLMRNSA